MSGVKNMILVLDDDPMVRDLLCEDLPSHGFEVFACATSKAARQLLEEKPIDAILLDYNLSDTTGADFFRSIQNVVMNIPVIFITNFPNVEQAVNLMKEGAADYILKPFSVPDVAGRLRRTIEIRSLRAEVNYHRRRQLPATGKYEWVGASQAADVVKRSIMEVARAPTTPVLITGETGVGKEVVARLIHQKTHGDEQPFVEVDCTTIPKPLFESELFGHERGAFTGADRIKEGIFELGKSGTIFLDEMGDMDLELQSRLLRALETHQFRRVGGTRPISFGARVVAATNRDLQRLVEQKEFRADLYYRLAVYQIHVPPLRERRADIPALAEYFLREAAAQHGKSIDHLSKNFLQKIEPHDFPGNVRELRNLVEQAVLQTDSGEADIHGNLRLSRRADMVESAPVRISKTETTHSTTLSANERSLIETALQDNHGNKSAAARQLGISRPALLRKMARLKVESL